MNAKEQTTLKSALQLLSECSTIPDYRVNQAVKLLQPLLAIKPKKSDCAICYDAITGESIPWLGKNLKDMQAHRDCGEAYRVNLHATTWQRFDAPRVSHFNFALAGQCACGHQADQHIADHLDNLLDCRHNDCDCDHFRMKQAA